MASVRGIFRGPRGVRAGWRLLLFLSIAIGLFTVFQYLVLLTVKRTGVRVPPGLDPIVLGVSDICVLVATLLATAIMARWEHRRLGDYGLPGRDAFAGRFWGGCVFGFAAVTLLIVLIWAAGGYSFGSRILHGRPLAHFAALWIATSLLIGFAEEFFFRGYPQFTLAAGMGFWPAAAVISFLFGALHFFTKPYERWPDWACTSLLALFLCLTLRRTGDLRFAIGMHAAFDFGAIFIYSGPNGGELARGHLLSATFHGPIWLTGGPLGPEASLLVFPVIALMFIVFHLLYREAHFFPGSEPPLRTGARQYL